MTRSYWQIRNQRRARNYRDLPDFSRVYDIAVIGAGIMGIALAHYLKTMGCQRVIVLEKAYVAYGASGRNAGFLLSGMAEPYSRLVVGMGPERAKLLMRATLENHDLVAEAAADINCDYQRSGSYHLAVSEVEKRELFESVDLLFKDGFAGNFIDSDRIREKIGFGNYNGGYFCASDGNLDPYAFVNGLSEDLEVIEGFAVRSISKSDGYVTLDGNRGLVRAEMAVLATNAYSPLLDVFFNELIFPVRGQMLASSNNLESNLGNSTYYANFGYDYFRRSPDGAVLMGGLRDKFADIEIGYVDDINPKLQDGLEDYIRANIGVDNLEIQCRWSGLMANTIDGLPLVGTLPHNSAVVAAVGCNGHGFGLGMIIARDLARALMTGQTSDLLKIFSLKRFTR